MIRLFISIDIPEDVKKELTELRLKLSGARWVSSENYHLTLAFLGECGQSDFALLEDVFEYWEAPSFELQLSGLGCFGPKKSARSLWVGVKENSDLNGLQKNISDQLRDIGFDIEKRKFTPHVTLARLKRTPFNQLAQILSEGSIYSSRPFIVDSFHLYSSKLKEEGVLYTKLASFRLF